MGHITNDNLELHTEFIILRFLGSSCRSESTVRHVAGIPRTCKKAKVIKEVERQGLPFPSRLLTYCFVLTVPLTILLTQTIPNNQKTTDREIGKDIPR